MQWVLQRMRRRGRVSGPLLLRELQERRRVRLLVLTGALLGADAGWRCLWLSTQRIAVQMIVLLSGNNLDHHSVPATWPPSTCTSAG